MSKNPSKGRAELGASTDPGTSVQIENNDLIEGRTPIRRRITLLCNQMDKLVQSNGSRTLLQRKQEELQTLWVQCQKMDERLKEIFSEHEDEEGFEKEGEFQFAYEEKVAMTLSAAERFLEEKKGESSSSETRTV